MDDIPTYREQALAAARAAIVADVSPDLDAHQADEVAEHVLAQCTPRNMRDPVGRMLDRMGLTADGGRREVKTSPDPSIAEARRLTLCLGLGTGSDPLGPLAHALATWDVSPAGQWEAAEARRVAALDEPDEQHRRRGKAKAAARERDALAPAARAWIAVQSAEFEKHRSAQQAARKPARPFVPVPERSAPSWR